MCLWVGRLVGRLVVGPTAVAHHFHSRRFRPKPSCYPLPAQMSELAWRAFAEASPAVESLHAAGCTGDSAVVADIIRSWPLWDVDLSECEWMDDTILAALGDTPCVALPCLALRVGGGLVVGERAWGECDSPRGKTLRDFSASMDLV